MKKISVSLKDRPYNIFVGHALVKNCGNLFRKLDIGKDAVIISNKTLLELYKKPIESSLRKAAFTTHYELVPDSEKAKSINVLSKLLNSLCSYDTNRTLFIIALGGGVIGDLAGFTSAIYKRGVPYIQIPTTLLAQVDSAIGGKTAVDLHIAKNMVGTFYQPKAVLSDVSILRSLPVRQIKNGLSEVIKYGVIGDPLLFRYIETHYHKILDLDTASLEFIISRASAIKARIVEKDEFDTKGIRAALNYGHTFGHAIEAASGYSNRFNHGEAVAIGMVIAAQISARMGFLKKVALDRIEALVTNCGLPATIGGLNLSDIYTKHLHDKKFIHGKNRLVLPTGIGSIKIVENVPEAVIKSVLRERAG